MSEIRKLVEVHEGEAYPVHGENPLVKYRYVTPDGRKFGIQVDAASEQEVSAWWAEADAAGAELERYQMDPNLFAPPRP